LVGLVIAVYPGGTPDAATVLASLAATRRLAAELERSELARRARRRSVTTSWVDSRLAPVTYRDGQ
jgi:hypothetical protein